jgi:uroporphyrin-3 C-methyltransferase
MNRPSDSLFESGRSSLGGRRGADSGERRGSRITTTIAVVALATAVYSLLRLDGTRDRVDNVKDLVHGVEASQAALRNDLVTLTKNEEASRRNFEAQMRSFASVPDELRDLSSSVEEIRGRSEGPQRAWSRAEALFLLELAQRRLGLDRDVATARSALDAADSRLASLHEPALTAVREQIAKEQRALADLHEPDRSGILVRLSGVEDQVTRVAVKGVLAGGNSALEAESLPAGFFARAWAVTRRTFGSLFTIEQVHGQAGNIVSSEEELLRRQHLQLLLFSARIAVIRHDNEAYRAALSNARRWLDQYFDVNDRNTAELRREIDSLSAIDVDPPLPDISRSSQVLQRLTTPAERGKS